MDVTKSLNIKVFLRMLIESKNVKQRNAEEEDVLKGKEAKKWRKK